MKKMKVNYSTTQNLGDLLNVLIAERILDCEFIHSNRFVCASTGIGSGLGRFFVKDSVLNHTAKGIAARELGKLMPPLRVWSAGFIEYPKEKEFSLRKDVKVASVRGEITKQRLEKILNCKLDNTTTGDGGLLAALLIEKKVEKKYEIGIIPHLREKGLPVFDKIMDANDNTRIIDIAGEPMQILEEIASCEYILSSSLHGLIVSDSFGIPNQRLVVSEKLVGDGYKFDDYYSSFGIKGNVYKITENEKLMMNQIIDNYEITKEVVSQKQKEIVEAFNRYI